MADDEDIDDEIEIKVKDEPEDLIDVDEPEEKPKDDDKEYIVDELDAASEDKRDRRRLTTAQKKAAQREARERLESKVKALTAKNLEMERRIQAAEGSQVGLRLEGLKNKKEDIQNLYNQTTQKLTEFETTGNLRGTREATELRFRLENEYKAIEQQEQQISQYASRPAPLDGNTVNYFKGWVDRNKEWYKGDMSNRDSRIADDISKDLVNEGFMTSQPEFWEELDRRCTDYIPSKRKRAEGKRAPKYDDLEDDDARPQTVGGKGSSSRSESGRQVVQIDSYTVQQWKDAGIWEDPTERQKAIKIYQEEMTKGARHG